MSATFSIPPVAMIPWKISGDFVDIDRYIARLLKSISHHSLWGTPIKTKNKEVVLHFKEFLKVNK